MTHIKIEVPANDHIALSAMAEALNRIAAERAPSIPVRGEPSVTDLCVKPFSVPTSEDVKRTMVKLANNETFGGHTNPYAEQVDVEIEAIKDTVNELHACLQIVKVEVPEHIEQNNTLDADGLPWDNRIHSRGKTRLSDDTWRLARKPNDKTDEEWSTYVESVKSELKAVQDIPTLDETVTPPTIEDVGYDASTPIDDKLTPPVIDEPAIQFEGVTPNGDVAIEPPVTTVGAPVAPLTPPTSLTPPVVEAPVVVTPPTSLTPPVTSNQPSVTTFQELMLYITGNAKKRGADNELIKSTLLEVDPALVAIPLIATRADLIPKFVAALEAKLS